MAHGLQETRGGVPPATGSGQGKAVIPCFFNGGGKSVRDEGECPFSGPCHSWDIPEKRRRPLNRHSRFFRTSQTFK
ncbi:hypothetical protein SI90_04715 [Akkermansia muciniphila]|nr:hypothetical protein [Akkermansia muciniphila]QAR49939.1 hypothetical protein SI90_04715 [Akkermansia muciniphila]